MATRKKTTRRKRISGMDKEKFERMAGVIRLTDEMKFENSVRGMMKDLFEDGFDEEDVESFLKKLLQYNIESGY